MMLFVEAFVASFGILVFGFISIPVAAWLVGASVNMAQGAGMSLIFFVMRFLWLYALRHYFEQTKTYKAKPLQNPVVTAWLAIKSIANWLRAVDWYQFFFTATVIFIPLTFYFLGKVSQFW